MSRARVALLCLLSAGCRSAQPATTNDTKDRNAAVTARPDAGLPDSGPTDAGAVENLIPLDQYRTAFLRDLMRLTKTREATLPPADQLRADAAAVPHSIEVLKRIGQAESYVVTTAGFGRIAHGGRQKGHVELLAYVEQYGPKVGEVLEALGEAMHAQKEKPWKEYDTVQLPSPKHGMEYFDLRAAGEIDVSADLRIELLKVIPMSREEFEKSQDNPSAEWDDPNANARAIQRWRRLLER